MPRKPRQAPRPRTRGKVTGTPVLVRLQPGQLAAIDRAKLPGMSRADVIRSAIERGLTVAYR